jgi:D-psicose/D-tagatose/L-ribulose 3-epimerase
MDENFKGKNRVGLNLLLWTQSVSEKMNPVAGRLKEIGYDGVEVCLGETRAAPYVDYGRYLKSIDMGVTTVFVVGKDENPADESQAIRDKALEKMKWAIERSNDLGAKIICGPVHSAFSYFSRMPPTREEYKRSAEVLYKAGEYAAQSGSVIAIEALNRYECYLCNTVEQLNQLIAMTGHPNIRPMYDTFHANIEEKNALSIAGLKGLLAHVHISENDRGTPGDGHILFDHTFEQLAKINYHGWFTIEAFSRLDPSFANGINVWRDYSDPWDVAIKGLAFIRSMQAKYRL